MGSIRKGMAMSWLDGFRICFHTLQTDWTGLVPVSGHWQLKDTSSSKVGGTLYARRSRSLKASFPAVPARTKTTSCPLSAMMVMIGVSVGCVCAKMLRQLGKRVLQNLHVVSSLCRERNIVSRAIFATERCHNSAVCRASHECPGKLANTG